MNAAAELSIARLMEAYGVSDEGALAMQLGRDVGTLRVWRTRDMVPKLVLIEASKATGYAVEWLRGDADALPTAASPVVRREGLQEAVLNEREAALIANYRASAEEGRRALEVTGAALAQSSGKRKPKAA